MGGTLKLASCNSSSKTYALKIEVGGRVQTSPGTGDTATFRMGSTGAASAFCTPGSWGGLGTMASQAPSSGNPRAPKTKKRPRQPSVDSSRGDKKRPTRLPAGFEIMLSQFNAQQKYSRV